MAALTVLGIGSDWVLMHQQDQTSKTILDALNSLQFVQGTDVLTFLADTWWVLLILLAVAWLAAYESVPGVSKSKSRRP